jgi:hypothetical protein
MVGRVEQFVPLGYPVFEEAEAKAGKLADIRYKVGEQAVD